MTVLGKTVETIVRQYEVEVPEETPAADVYSKVDETEETRGGWTECDYTAIENITQVTTFDGKLLWVLLQQEPGSSGYKA